MNLTTRQASELDREWLYQLKVAAMREHVEAVYGWDETVQRRFFDDGFRCDDLVIFRVEGMDVGMFELSKESDGYFLKRIEIFPGFQRRGIGTRILRDILRQAASEGQLVRLQVLKANPARSLYSRLGFETVEETKHHYLMVMTAPEPSDAGRAGMHER